MERVVGDEASGDRPRQRMETSPEPRPRLPTHADTMQMDVRMGLMDGWMDGWIHDMFVDGWMHGWMDGWMDGWMLRQLTASTR
jgi:hypothetical protein